MPKSWILFSSDHNTFTQFSSESLANFRQACTVLSWAGGPRGRCRISVLHNVVLPIVFLVTIVPAALRSLTRSPHVVLGWFLTILMIIETPRGEILHLAAWRWSCSPIQPCVGLQSCPWHPWTDLWSWPWWRVWNLIDWLLLWTGCLLYR